MDGPTQKKDSQFSTNFLAITAADFIVRSAYQMGKTPLLPIFAASLGATDALLGVIVSVSTVTGMVLKPGIGLLSDKWGRRVWLFVGAIFFAGVPFLYRFVETPSQLFMIRLVHGTATAIYGPVTLAYVAEQSRSRTAERIGWFGAARSGGYIVGPIAAGWLLLWLSPTTVFSLIGVISLLAFIPLTLLSFSQPDQISRTGREGGGAKGFTRQRPWVTPPFSVLRSIREANAIWLAGGLEGFVYVMLYALRAFLPIYALAAGINVFWAGAFFSIQEVCYMVARPAGGRLGDRIGFRQTLSVGVGVLGFTLLLLSVVSFAQLTSVFTLVAVSVLLGCSQALLFPSIIALASTQIDGQYLGVGMGVIGSLKNAGKIAGPIMGGVLIGWFGYPTTLLLMGGSLWGGLVVIGVGRRVLDTRFGGRRAMQHVHGVGDD